MPGPSRRGTRVLYKLYLTSVFQNQTSTKTPIFHNKRKDSTMTGQGSYQPRKERRQFNPSGDPVDPRVPKLAKVLNAETLNDSYLSTSRSAGGTWPVKRMERSAIWTKAGLDRPISSIGGFLTNMDWTCCLSIVSEHFSRVLYYMDCSLSGSSAPVAPAS